MSGRVESLAGTEIGAPLLASSKCAPLAAARTVAAITPALEGERDAAPVADRHRTDRALRDLLERMASARPIVVCLDDVHWADVASVDALSALVRRPPALRSSSRWLRGKLSSRPRWRERWQLQWSRIAQHGLG